MPAGVGLDQMRKEVDEVRQDVDKGSLDEVRLEVDELRLEWSCFRQLQGSEQIRRSQKLKDLGGVGCNIRLGPDLGAFLDFGARIGTQYTTRAGVPTPTRCGIKGGAMQQSAQVGRGL